MRQMIRRGCLLFALTAVVAIPREEVYAADPVAESMFQQALQMMRDGKFEEAKQALEASHKLEPKSGTLLVLGSCNEQLGHTATAWAQYKEASGMARAEGRTEHVSKATELAKALEPRLSRLRIDAQRLQGGVQLVVKLDGVVVLDGQLGVAFAIDPGKHVVTATAPGRAEWSSTIAVEAGKDPQIVAVPELDVVKEAPPPPTATPRVPPPAPDPKPTGPSDKASRSGGGVGPVWAWIVGGSGVAIGAVAIGFGVDQQAVSSELYDRCGEKRTECPRGYDFEGAREREVRDFDLFLGLGLTGLVATSTGVLGLALTPSEEPGAAAWLEVGPGSASVVGRF